jgi:hypothetical protein
MTNSSYLRLSPKSRTWTGFSQAWLGSDHLLIVNSNRLVERYQRFAFADIQAIVVTEGGRRAVWQAVAASIWFAASIAVQVTFGKGFFATLGLVALIWAILDIARGPRCRCVLQTAVSRERLHPISRMRTARAFLATISPAIESVQGSVPVEDLVAQAAMRTPLTDNSDSMVQPPAIERPLSYAPEILFGLLMLDGVLVLVALRSPIGVALGLLPTVYFAEFLIGIFALVQSRARSAATIAILIAAFLGVLIDPFALSGVAVWPSLVAAFRQGPSGQAQWNIPIAAPATTLMFAVGWRAILALTGLAACHFERAARRN